MSKQTRLLLGAACAAMLVAFSGIMFPAAIPDGAVGFAVGLSAGLMVGVLYSARDRRDSQSHG